MIVLPRHGIFIGAEPSKTIATERLKFGQGLCACDRPAELLCAAKEAMSLGAQLAEHLTNSAGHRSLR